MHPASFYEVSKDVYQQLGFDESFNGYLKKQSKTNPIRFRYWLARALHVAYASDQIRAS